MQTAASPGWTHRVVLEHGPARTVLAVTSFALLTALGAHVALPLPWTPVPLTLQTFFVVLSGAVLGARGGAASQVAYLAAGLAGAPIFALGMGGPLVLFGPTAGYLLAFPLAAALSGSLMGLCRGRGLAWRSLALLAAMLTIHLMGALWLGTWTGQGPLAGFVLGSLPFLPGAAIKAVAAGAVVPEMLRRWEGPRP